MKQAIIIRNDLKMGKGKIASQCAHASVAAFLKSRKYNRDKWVKKGMKKIVLKISSEKNLIKLYKKGKEEKIPCEVITDAGLTQIEPGTITALGMGPDKDEKIDKIIKNLKLL